jgi:radical SAM protein with 4Fe4S-binding SPASM domain
MRGNLLAFAWQGLRALATRRLRIYGDLIPYDFERLPFNKLINACLVEASTVYKPLQPWGWPTHLMVEPSAHCNLSCTLCPVTAGLERPQGHMDLRTFKSVIDDIGEYLFTLLLWDWGEPFTNPAIYDMISYAGRRGIKTISSTNGHLFAHQERADKVIHAGLDTLIFAVDGITQATYARYREGGQLDQALAGMQTVVARKRALRASKPLVNFRFIVMRHNEHEIPLLKELARSLGVNALTLKTFNPCYQDPYSTREAAKRGEDRLPQDLRYRRFHGKSIDSRVRRQRNPCKHPWSHPVIHWNGVVCSCTFDPHERYPLGDLRQKRLREIWSDEPYRRLRRRFREDWSQIPLCQQCTYAYEGGACRDETIAEASFFPEPLQPVRHV